MTSINDWAMSPILERKDRKADNLIAIGDRKDKFSKRYSTIEQAAAEINRVLEENYKLYFNILPESAYISSDFESDSGSLNNDKRSGGRNGSSRYHWDFSWRKIDQDFLVNK